MQRNYDKWLASKNEFIRKKIGHDFCHNPKYLYSILPKLVYMVRILSKA